MYYLFFKKTCELCLEQNQRRCLFAHDCEDALPQVKHRCLICAIPLIKNDYCGQCLHTSLHLTTATAVLTMPHLSILGYTT